MIKIFALSFPVLFFLNSFAQKHKGFLEIDGKQMFFVYDSIKDDEGEKYIRLDLINDSICHFTRPSRCSRYDTVCHIDPETKDSIFAISIGDTDITVGFNLGAVSRAKLSEAISNQLGALKNRSADKLKTMYIYIFNDKCGMIEVNYNTPEEITAAKQKIGSLPTGSTVVITHINFENNTPEFLNDLVMMKIY